jgi:hypothetical protein
MKLMVRCVATRIGRHCETTTAGQYRRSLLHRHTTLVCNTCWTFSLVDIGQSCPLGSIVLETVLETYRNRIVWVVEALWA